MQSNRTLLLITGVVLMILLALGAVGLWLFGGSGGPDEDAEPAAQTGIVFVRVVDTFAGKRMLTPVGIGAGSDGGFFVTLRDLAHVAEYDRGGDFVRSWGTRGLAAGQMMVPIGVAVDRAGGRVYVTDRSRLRLMCYDLEGNLRWEQALLNPLTPALTEDGVAVTTFGPVVRFDPEGSVLGEYGTRGESPGQFDYPRGIAVGPDGEAYIADSNNARVQRIQFSGELTATVDWIDGRPPLNQQDDSVKYLLPAGVTLDSQGRVYLLDGFRMRVFVLDPATGEQVHMFEFPSGSVPGQLYLPSGIAYLGGDTFAITDTGNDRVQIFRLLLPGENTPLRRNPWLWLLSLLLLLPLLPLLFKKRHFVTEETLERASAESRLRLLAAVLKKLHVLPDVYERYKDRVEDGVDVGQYFVKAEVPKEQPVDKKSRRTKRADAEEGLVEVPAKAAEIVAEAAREADPEELLARAAEPTRVQRLMFARHIVVCVDGTQCDRFTDRERKVRDYEEIVEEYELDSEGGAEAG